MYLKREMMYIDSKSNSTELSKMSGPQGEILICVDGVIVGVKSEYLTEPSAGQCFENKIIDKRYENLIIPEEINGQVITEIGEEAFAGIRNLKTVQLPSTITKIGFGGFGECISLSSITGFGECIELGGLSFAFCSSLTKLDFGECEVSANDILVFNKCTSLTTVSGEFLSLETDAFLDCYSLVNVDLGNSLTELGNGVFQNCTSLENIDLPSNLTRINNAAFKGCTSLSSIIIPSTVTRIGSYAFQECISLSSIRIPILVKYVGPEAFSGWGNTQIINCEATEEYVLEKWANSSWGAWTDGCAAIVKYEQ